MEARHQQDASGAAQEQVQEQVSFDEEGRQEVSREGGREEDFEREIVTEEAGEERVAKEAGKEVCAKQSLASALVVKGLSGEGGVKEGKEQGEERARPVIEADLQGDRRAEEAGRGAGEAEEGLEQDRSPEAGRGAQEGQGCARV